MIDRWTAAGPLDQCTVSRKVATDTNGQSLADMITSRHFRQLHDMELRCGNRDAAAWADRFSPVSAFERVNPKLKRLRGYRPLFFTPYFHADEFPFHEQLPDDAFRFGRISRNDVGKYGERQLWICETMTAPVLKEGLILGWGSNDSDDARTITSKRSRKDASVSRNSTNSMRPPS